MRRTQAFVLLAVVLALLGVIGLRNTADIARAGASKAKADPTQVMKPQKSCSSQFHFCVVFPEVGIFTERGYRSSPGRSGKSAYSAANYLWPSSGKSVFCNPQFVGRTECGESRRRYEVQVIHNRAYRLGKAPTAGLRRYVFGNYCQMREAATMSLDGVRAFGGLCAFYETKVRAWEVMMAVVARHRSHTYIIYGSRSGPHGLPFRWREFRNTFHFTC